MNLQKFGTYITQKRKDKGYTQKELANYVGISDKAISKWERGLSIPDIDNFEKLAQALDVEISDLWENGISNSDASDVIIDEDSSNAEAAKKEAIMNLFQLELAKEQVMSKKRKKRTFAIIGIVIAILLVGLIVYLWPHRINRLSEDSGNINIIIDANSPSEWNVVKVEQYEIKPGSVAYRDMELLIDNLKGHYTLKGITGSFSYTPREVGVNYIMILKDHCSMSIYPSIGLVSVDKVDEKGNLVEACNYKIGVGGTQEEDQLCSDILSILLVNDCENINVNNK